MTGASIKGRFDSSRTSADKGSSRGPNKGSVLRGSHDYDTFRDPTTLSSAGKLRHVPSSHHHDHDVSKGRVPGPKGGPAAHPQHDHAPNFSYDSLLSTGAPGPLSSAKGGKSFYPPSTSSVAAAGTTGASSSSSSSGAAPPPPNPVPPPAPGPPADPVEAPPAPSWLRRAGRWLRALLAGPQVEQGSIMLSFEEKAEWCYEEKMEWSAPDSSEEQLLMGGELVLDPATEELLLELLTGAREDEEGRGDEQPLEFRLLDCCSRSPDVAAQLVLVSCQLVLLPTLAEESRLATTSPLASAVSNAEQTTNGGRQQHHALNYSYDSLEQHDKDSCSPQEEDRAAGEDRAAEEDLPAEDLPVAFWNKYPAAEEEEEAYPVAEEEEESSAGDESSAEEMEDVADPTPLVEESSAGDESSAEEMEDVVGGYAGRGAHDPTEPTPLVDML